jgi:hypothetical protein
MERRENRIPAPASFGPVVTTRVRAIDDVDVPAVARFLHANLNSRVPAKAWADAIDVPWKVDAPNHGFLAEDADRIVGVYLAFYSQRSIDGRTERLCNLGAWCVLPDYRFAGLRLLKEMLAQPGYTFTDLSPSGAVIPLNVRLNFSFLDTATALMPNLPWPFGRGRIVTDPNQIRETLTGEDLQRYLDHEHAAAANHLLLVRGGEHCHVIFRRDRRKQLPLFASILYVSNPRLFGELAHKVSGHLLLRHGIPATLAEVRVVGRAPRGSLMLRNPRRKMYRSGHLDAASIDYLYSELVCVAW